MQNSTLRRQTFFYIMYKVSFCISHRTCPVSIIREQSVSVTFGNKIVCYKSNSEHTNPLYVQCRICWFSACGTYTYHWISRDNTPLAMEDRERVQICLISSTVVHILTTVF